MDGAEKIVGIHGYTTPDEDRQECLQSIEEMRALVDAGIVSEVLLFGYSRYGKTYIKRYNTTNAALLGAIFAEMTRLAGLMNEYSYDEKGAS